MTFLRRLLQDKAVRKRKAKDYGRVLLSAAAKGTKSLWFHVGKKRKKRMRKARERKKKRDGRVTDGGRKYRKGGSGFNRRVQPQLSLPAFQFLKWLVRHSSG